MLKETIHYKDFDNQDRVVVAYFHLTEKEVVDLQAHSENGLQADLEEAAKSNNAGRVLDYITNLVHISYGIKSQDGKHFRKTQEILDDFISSAFYSDFLLGLIQDDGKKAQEFLKGIMPKELLDRALAQENGQVVGEPDRTVHQSTVYAPSARETFEQRQSTIQDVTPASEFVPAAAPQVSPTSQNPAETHTQQDERERAEFLAWKAQQESARQAQQQEGFRVPVEEPVTGMPRPPFEQNDSDPA